MNPGLTEAKQWFTDSRFGLMICWGLYAIPARGEWLRSLEELTIEQYQSYFDEFNPIHFDPKAWAQAAKAAGQQYAVLITKHHDGFCLFDSKYTDYKSVNTRIGKDLVKEYAEAFREAGIKVGFYFSLLDWHHPDYPSYGDKIHPMRNNPEFQNIPTDFNRYLDYMHHQVRELLTNYGKIDLLWFDFSYGELNGEAWKASELMKMVYSLQPDIVVNDRLCGNVNDDLESDLLNGSSSLYSGDFVTAEQILPYEGIRNRKGDPIPWEACMTMNNHWGYTASDKDFKSPKQIVRALLECVSKGGNYLLNVGPDAKGRFPDESLDILAQVGGWMKRNGESIYGCGAAGLDKPEWGRYTRKGHILYAHILDRGVCPINLRGLHGKIKKARLLSDGSEISLDRPWNASKYLNDAFITIGNKLPDEWDTVVELELCE